MEEISTRQRVNVLAVKGGRSIVIDGAKSPAPFTGREEEISTRQRVNVLAVKGGGSIVIDGGKSPAPFTGREEGKRSVPGKGLIY